MAAKTVRFSKRISIASAEPLLVLLAAPLLLFPRGPLPWIGLGLILLGLLARGLATGRWFVRTPLDRPVAILLVMTFVALYVSVDRTLSMPKFFGIILGFAVYYAVVANVFTERQFWIGVTILVAGVLAVVALGLFGTAWNTTKYAMLRPIYTAIPKLIKNVDASVGSVSGFNPNELGGALAFLLPVPIALAISKRLAIRWRALLSLVVLVGVGMLVLSASRTGLAAFLAALLAVVVWRWRRVGLALAGIAITAFAVILITNGSTLTDLFLRLDVANPAWNEYTFASRTEIWDRARYMIEDFPYTGIGLNTFPTTLNKLYPLFTVVSDVGPPHAHNIFLQAAVDFGLGGLFGFLGLGACLTFTGIRAYRLVSNDEKVGPSVQAALAGLLAGALAYLVFGLTDAITLGAKPAVLLWLMFGLIVAAGRLSRHYPPSARGDEPSGTEGERPAVNKRRTSTAAWFLLGVLRETYWMIAYFLVALGLLVVAVRISGWTP